MGEVKDLPRDEAATDVQGNGSGPKDEAEQALEALMEAPDGQLSLGVGGKAPDASAFKLIGGKIATKGQFKKGQVVRLEALVRVDEVAFVDVIDPATKRAVGCERRHKARFVQEPEVSAVD